MAFRSLLPEVRRSERGVWNPMREMSRLQRRIDRVFDEFLTEPSFFRPSQELLTTWPTLEEGEFAPACDVEETDSHYLLSFDLPGIKKDDVKIDLQENQLTVSGERKEETKGRASRERYYGAFCRSFMLPSNVSADKVEANYENGVLQIALPKTQVAPGKQIPIKEGKLIESKPGKAA